MYVSDWVTWLGTRWTSGACGSKVFHSLSEEGLIAEQPLALRTSCPRHSSSLKYCLLEPKVSLIWSHYWSFQGYIIDISTQMHSLHRDFEHRWSLLKWQRWHIRSSENNLLPERSTYPPVSHPKAMKWICISLECNLRFRRFTKSVSGRKSWCDLPKLQWRIWLGITQYFY